MVGGLLGLGQDTNVQPPILQLTDEEKSTDYCLLRQVHDSVAEITSKS